MRNSSQSNLNRRPLRVRHVGLEDATARPGGLNRYLFALVDAERSLGIDAEAVVLDGPDSTDLTGIVHSGTMRQSIGRRLRSMSRGALLSPLPDLYDSHFALYSVLPLLSAARRRPWVVHFQGPWADESAAEGGSWVSTTFKRRLERAVYGHASRIVVLSRAFEQLVIDRYGVAADRVRRIPPGVDLERFTPGSRIEARRRLGLDEDLEVILAVRRLRNRMGLEVALEAVAHIAVRRPVLLVVVGTGPERQRLEALADSNGAPVRFAGRVNDIDLADWYRAANVSVVPTTALEGFGLVVLESLAVGTPVVVSEVDGLIDAVAGLENAVVVQPGDPAALAAGLEEVLDGGGPGPDACRVHAEKFSWAKVAQQHEQLYQELVGGRRKIVVIAHTAQLSGGELALARIVPALLERAEVHVILAQDGPLVDRLLKVGASVEVLTLVEEARSLHRDEVRISRSTLAAVAASSRYVVRLARRLRELRPDVVHTNTLKAALYGSSAARLARVPTVTWHLRDRIEDDYLPKRVATLVRTAARLLPDGVIANSTITLDTLGALSIPSCVVPSPVELSMIAHQRGPRSVVRVGVLGRLAPWKGQHLFLEAFADAARGTSAVAVVIGAPLFGEEDYEAEIKGRARSLGIEEQVEWRGFQEDIAAELARLDILVHSSVIPEPFGQVVVEGMAAGLAVLAADQGGPSLTITDGSDGLLYRMGDRRALATRLGELLESPDLRSALGQQGVITAQQYLAPAMAAKMFDFWDGLWKRRG